MLTGDQHRRLRCIVRVRYAQVAQLSYVRINEGLTSFRKELKRTKKAAALRDDMALRDQVKGRVGSPRGKGRYAGSVNNGALPITDAHRARAAVLAARTGSSAFQSFSVRDLRESIEECGARPPSAMNKAELQLMLRSLAPGIGRDTDEEAEEGLGQPGGAGT